MREKRSPKLYEAVIILLSMILMMAVAIIGFGADPHIPMLLSTGLAAILALKLGYDWNEIEEAMIIGITRALQSLMILAVIGVLIGTWILSGVVPSMIYYGLQILNPTIFLVTSTIITTIVSLATGSAWGTAGTIGIALMGVSQGLGIPAPITAGSIVSGAYFGDKLSPLSDTTNLAPAMAGTDLFTHIKHMFSVSSITYVISLVFFLVVGFIYGGDGSAHSETLLEIVEGLQANFVISPLLLLPPIIVVVMVALKVPALPGIFIGAVLGMIFAVIFQGSTLGEIFSSGMYGFVIDSGSQTLDGLLNNGGLGSMMYSISLGIIAMMFGGIMESTGQLEVIVNFLLRRVESAKGLVALTLATSVFANLTMSSQYIAIIMPGRMYAQSYRDKNIHPKTLSLSLETGGTLSSPLIPWNNCGAFMYSVLGVSVLEYAPWAFLNYSTLILVLILAFMGSGKVIRTIDDAPNTVKGKIKDVPA